MDKVKAIQIMREMQMSVKATPVEHNMITEAINFLETLEQPKKAD